MAGSADSVEESNILRGYGIHVLYSQYLGQFPWDS